MCLIPLTLCPCCETKQEVISGLLFFQVTVTFWIIMGGEATTQLTESQWHHIKAYHLQQACHHFLLGSRAQPGLTSPVWHQEKEPSSCLVLLELLGKTCSYHLSHREAPCWLLRLPASQAIIGIIVLTGSFLNEL